MGLVVKGLIDRGQMAGASQPMPTEYIESVADDLGYDIEIVEGAEVAATRTLRWSAPRSSSRTTLPIWRRVPRS